MKKTIYSFSLFIGLSICALAQTYTGTAWKAGGWNFGTDNNVNFAVENVIDAWQYDIGTYMPLPTDFTNAIADFKAGDFAAGQIKSVSSVDLVSCAAMGTRQIWDAVNSVSVLSAFRLGYLNKRKGDNTERVALACPAILPGSEVLDPADPALYAIPAAFCMNDAYGRLGSAGAALRYSITVAPGNYHFLFKGNGSQIVDFRLLKREANNALTEVYVGTVSATAATNMFTKLTGAGGTTEHGILAGYEKLVDHMRLYANNACVFSVQKNTAGEVLALTLNGNYVVELISNGSSGAIGAFTFESVSQTGISTSNSLKNAIVYHNNNQIVVKLNNSGRSNIKVFNLAGSLVAERANIEQEGVISTFGFSKGIYLVKIENGKNTELRKLQVVY